jgi:hypothetical protein
LDVLEAVIAELAAVYADHPEFHPSWLLSTPLNPPDRSDLHRGAVDRRPGNAIPFRTGGQAPQLPTVPHRSASPPLARACPRSST